MEIDSSTAVDQTMRIAQAQQQATKKKAEEAVPKAKGTGYSGESSFKATDDYAKWEKFAKDHNVPVEHGKVTVIGLRNDSTADTKSGSTYEDQMVVLKKDGTTATFTANTKPAQQPETPGAAPDVDGDHVMDLGMARPGNYKAFGNRTFAGRPAYQVSSTLGKDEVPAWRDTNHDGTFSPEEKQASERRGDKLSAVRIHVGFDEAGSQVQGKDGKPVSGSGPFSIGCQNVPSSNMDEFVDAVGGKQASFNYSVVEAPVARADSPQNSPGQEKQPSGSGTIFDNWFK